MVGGKGCRRDGDRPAIKPLGFARAPCFFGNDGEVVQRVGEIRMEWPEAGLLQKGSLAEKLFSCRVITGRGRLFRRIDDGLRFARFRHGFPRAESLGARLWFERVPL